MSSGLKKVLNLNGIYSLFSIDMGIDLGTANTLVCIQGEGIILSEPSVVAINRKTGEVLDSEGGYAVGNAAKEMLGRTPGSIQAIRPLKNGVIADFDITEKMLRYFIGKVQKNRRLGRPRMVISIPSGITAVEKRAVVNSAELAGAREGEVYMIDEPKAAAIGVNLPFLEPTGSMIVDIGGGTTEVAVISLGGVVVSESIRTAGDDMDEAIINHMKRTYNLLIGEQTAERIKIAIGSASALEKELKMEVKGRDLLAGLPRSAVITSEEIREALLEPVGNIVDAIKSTLERTPAELSADLVDQGIVLCGGGALLRGLDRLINEEVELPVRVADDPLTAVAKGTAVVLDRLDALKETLDTGDSPG